MINPTEDDIGRSVIFTGYTHPNAERPEGVLTSFNAVNGFVRFGSGGSEACGLDCLEWTFPAEGGGK